MNWTTKRQYAPTSPSESQHVPVGMSADGLRFCAIDFKPMDTRRSTREVNALLQRASVIERVDYATLPDRIVMTIWYREKAEEKPDAKPASVFEAVTTPMQRGSLESDGMAILDRMVENAMKTEMRIKNDKALDLIADRVIDRMSQRGDGAETDNDNS